MAQDFFAAFGNGGFGVVGNDTTLTGSDVAGINMITIKGLEERTVELNSIIEKLIAENQALQSKVNEVDVLKTNALSYNRAGDKKRLYLKKKMKVSLLNFVDESKCFEYLRLLRWSEGVNCPHCDSIEISKNGFDHTQVDKQRYKCNTCRKGFDDLSGTIFSGSNKRLKVWLLVLYFMGLNLSNRQIAEELDMTQKTAQRMTEVLRAGIVKKKADIHLKE